jgi:DNA polymerase beta
MDPHAIAAKLAPICEAYKCSGSLHKYHAYRIAIDSIKRYAGGPVTSSGQLKDLKGVGKSMLAKIDELLATGALQQEAQVRADPVQQALTLFTAIHGIGPVLARKLVVEQGLRTLDELEALGSQLAPQVRLGLKYHAEASQRIPFDEIEDHVAFVRRIARKVDKQLTVTVCGSHRRGLATSGDIDVLLTHPATDSGSGSEYIFLAALLTALRAATYVVDTLSEGPHKFMGYCRLPPPPAPSPSSAPAPPCVAHRLDMRWFPYDSYFPALLYFTGSDMFNVNMRTTALKLGYTMNEYGVYKLRGGGGGAGEDAAQAVVSPSKAGAGFGKGERVAVESEADIFSLLQMKYVAPTDRCV